MCRKTRIESIGKYVSWDLRSLYGPQEDPIEFGGHDWGKTRDITFRTLEQTEPAIQHSRNSRLRPGRSNGPVSSSVVCWGTRGGTLANSSKEPSHLMVRVMSIHDLKPYTRYSRHLYQSASFCFHSDYRLIFVKSLPRYSETGFSGSTFSVTSFCVSWD